ncbi:polysaccharide deacetylase family protein [Vineibacter terrae]|uniref:polysaccharide deacetylase family protein n=1 Tax=Vineibacter terrae TaxID=2586908 RepID=UPI002E2FD6D2|nr:polysaccharide deacetylase family protein [Vineibacter terrae]HEX2885373.1 polysaccharide deacetylase family protein [Vineibacter terrae]
MPWKDRYTISDEVGLADADIVWPDGARCCVTVTVCLGAASGPQGLTAADMRTPEAYFAANDGIEQLMRVLDRHGMRVTFAVPGVLAPPYRHRLRALVAAGHEVAALGFRHEDVTTLARDEEKDRLARTTVLIAEAAGARPLGWFALPRQSDAFAGGAISPSTIDLLIEAGYTYLGNGLADDIPHWWVADFATRRALLALPYYYHFDDQFFHLFPGKGTGLEHADSLFRNWRAEFAAQYRRGRQFHMVLHPQHSGWAHRAQLLDTFLQDMRSHPGLWTPTGRELADYWLKAYPQERFLKLEPSIWQDHEGSLS